MAQVYWEGQMELILIQSVDIMYSGGTVTLDDEVAS